MTATNPNSPAPNTEAMVERVRENLKLLAKWANQGTATIGLYAIEAIHFIDAQQRRIEALASIATDRVQDDDAEWLRENAERLVRYEEDAQRIRRIAARLTASPQPASDGEDWRIDCEFLLSVIDSCDEAEAPSDEMEPEDVANIARIRRNLSTGGNHNGE